jgi:hypothetical protein
MVFAEVMQITSARLICLKHQFFWQMQEVSFSYEKVPFSTQMSPKANIDIGGHPHTPYGMLTITTGIEWISIFGRGCKIPRLLCNTK